MEKKNIDEMLYLELVGTNAGRPANDEDDNDANEDELKWKWIVTCSRNKLKIRSRISGGQIASRCHRSRSSSSSSLS